MTVKYYLNAKLINADASTQLAPTGQYFPGNIMLDFEKREVAFYEYSVSSCEWTRKTWPWGMVDLSEATETQGVWNDRINIVNGSSNNRRICLENKVQKCVIPKLGEVNVGDDLSFRDTYPRTKYYVVDSIHPLYDSNGILTGDFFLKIGWKDSYNVSSDGSWGVEWVIGRDSKKYSRDEMQKIRAAA